MLCSKPLLPLLSGSKKQCVHFSYTSHAKECTLPDPAIQPENPRVCTIPESWTPARLLGSRL